MACRFARSGRRDAGHGRSASPQQPRMIFSYARRHQEPVVMKHFHKDLRSHRFFIGHRPGGGRRRAGHLHARLGCRLVTRPQSISALDKGLFEAEESRSPSSRAAVRVMSSPSFATGAADMGTGGLAASAAGTGERHGAGQGRDVDLHLCSRMRSSRPKTPGSINSGISSGQDGGDGDFLLTPTCPGRWC